MKSLFLLSITTLAAQLGFAQQSNVSGGQLYDNSSIQDTVTLAVGSNAVAGAGGIRIDGSSAGFSWLASMATGPPRFEQR
jgi:hypothetical protein